MHAVDTNVLVRFWVDDDPEQSARARALVLSKPIWVTKSVLLESAWVLERLYGYDETAICNTFARLLSFENVHVEDRQLVAVALSLCAQGLDLADAIHLTSRQPGSTFATFDQALLKRAKRAGIGDIEQP